MQINNFFQVYGILTLKGPEGVLDLFFSLYLDFHKLTEPVNLLNKQN